ncbi:MAG TPA: hypothetical protein VG323_21190, partial [Thermoanaerobaculia bacterium]|nr:hypothetical protein [Thermoanaerobaculia bacterium]
MFLASSTDAKHTPAMNARRPAWPVERTLLLPVAAVLLAVLGTAGIVLSAGRRDTTAAVTRLVAQIARESEKVPLDPAVVRLLLERDHVVGAQLGGGQALLPVPPAR